VPGTGRPAIYVYDSHTLRMIVFRPDISVDNDPFSPDGSQMAAYDDSHHMGLWDTATWKHTSEVYVPSPKSFTWLPTAHS